jgi:putative phosphoserine phosphatase/1-acylglycerol-3-phosphate O-acyltransferase
MGVGLGVGLLRGDRRLGADLACAMGFDAFLSLAGVKLRVVGEHNMWAQRPAVFVMNHQSGLDAMIVSALMRHHFSGLGKKEGRYSPMTFLMGKATDAVFIDRSDPVSAREQLSRLEDRLRDGLSVFVAPEGTRSPTPVLAPFKTGGFHVAMNAGVPVVPVVIRNAYDLMPGSAKTIRPGTVDVAVLDPIPTHGWTKETVRAEVAAVQKIFEHTLENWPEEAS